MSQVGEGGDEKAGAEAESTSGRQRGDGGVPENHGSSAKETHSDQEGERPGLESTEGEGEHPETAGWIKKQKRIMWSLREI